MSSDVDVINSVYQSMGEGIFGAPVVSVALLERDPDERAFLALIMCDAEIGNGGFEQLITNSSGDVANPGLTGAERFGLDDHAAVLREVVHLFPDHEVPNDLAKRIDQWEAVREQLGDEFDERLDVLEERWFGLEDALLRRLADFVHERDGTT